MTPPLRLHSSEFVLSPENPGGETKRPPLHPQEKALVVITALHMCFLPWAVGTMHVWSQCTSLGLAAVGFVLAVWPRGAGEDFNGASRSGQRSAAGLLRSRLLWVCLIFFAYIIVQGLNPAWHLMSDEETWWLEPLDPVVWLPSGVDAPFVRSNPWRELVIFGSLALLVGSVWLGFSRRKSYHVLFTTLAINAGLLALFGLAQRLSGTTLMFWSYPPSNSRFVASFIYPNHAGPYLYLMAALAIGLAWWHRQRARKQLENPGAAAAFVGVACCCGLLVIFSFSRLSILLLLVLLLFVGGALVWRLFRRTGPARSRPESLPILLLVAGVLLSCLVALQLDRNQERFAGLFKDPATAVLDRTLPRQAAVAMFRDHWLYGWGAGCFRYGFSKYTKAYPEIHYFPHGPRRYWEHAHNDLIEFPVEFGVVGLLPVAVILGVGGWQIWRRRVWRNVLSFSLVLGCGLIVVHAWADFVFHNPAILLTWGVLLAGALRWVELDQPGGRPNKTGPV